MGVTAKRKGSDGECKLTADLAGYGYDMKRMGYLPIREVPDLEGLSGVHIEVKRVERLNVPEAIQLAVKDATRFHDVFNRRNGQPWYVTIRLELYQGKD